MADSGADDAEADLPCGRPVWLLDVDGVVNVNRPGWGGPPRKSHVWSDTDQGARPVSASALAWDSPSASAGDR